jgi:uncharacterized protein (DUF427 family)
LNWNKDGPPLRRSRWWKPWRGIASLEANHEPVSAVWLYEQPYPAVAEIKDHVAFYPDRVDLAVSAPDAVED